MLYIVFDNSAEHGVIIACKVWRLTCTTITFRCSWYNQPSFAEWFFGCTTTPTSFLHFLKISSAYGKSWTNYYIANIPHHYHLSLSCGNWHDILKESVISLLLKKSTLDKDRLSNCHPVSNFLSYHSFSLRIYSKDFHQDRIFWAISVFVLVIFFFSCFVWFHINAAMSQLLDACKYSISKKSKIEIRLQKYQTNKQTNSVFIKPLTNRSDSVVTYLCIPITGANTLCITELCIVYVVLLFFITYFEYWWNCTNACVDWMMCSCFRRWPRAL